MRILAENAERIAEWLATRGGVASWGSINLSDPGKIWTTPVNQADGTPAGKPSWEADSKPFEVVTDAAEIVVDVPREVKRFRVAVRMGSQGMALKLTDGSTRKVRRAVEKAGEGAWYEFDYSTQEAVIFAPDSSVPLDAYLAAKSGYSPKGS